MLTLGDMIKGTFDLRTGVESTGSFEVIDIAVGPGQALGNVLAFKAKFNAKTDLKMGYYETIIAWHGVDMSFVQDDDHPRGFKVLKELVLYPEKPSINGTKCQVMCLCKDYYYTWWYFDYQQKSLAGPKLPKYVRKDGYDVSDPLRPRQRNPKKAPGLCKHILRLVQSLKQEEYIKQ